MAMRLIYITTKDKAEAESIGRALVERRLAACVNIVGGMTSIYHWKGQIETASEAVLIAKTEEHKAEALMAAVRELHSYEVPCSLVLPVLGGNPAYLHWLDDSLKS